MRLIGPALTNGFTMAGVMWCVWFLMHLPGTQPAPAVQGSFILAGMVCSGIFAGRWITKGVFSLVVGAAAGLVCGCVNLLWVLSYLTSAPDGNSAALDAAAQTALHPSTALFIMGFLGMSVGIGALTTFLGANLLPKPKHSAEPIDWHAKFAVVAAVLILPLLLIGALVTSTGSGLAVPDWPGTYGANMIMYPIGLMTRPRIVIEHGHRLFGMLIGLTTTVLMLQSVLGHRPVWLKYWAVALFVLVIFQGYLGGLRVNEKSQWLAVFHGVVAQAFFALSVGYAVCVSPLFGSLGTRGHLGTGFARPILEEVLGTSAEASRQGRRLKIFAAATTHSLVLQLIFGAMYRHVRVAHALWAHIGFSIVVVVAACATGFIAVRLSQEAVSTRLRGVLRRLGSGLVAVVFMQFVLGWAAFWVVQTTERTVTPAEEATTAPQVATHAAIIPTLHQANGAALLAVATMTYVWSIRLRKLRVG